MSQALTQVNQENFVIKAIIQIAHLMIALKYYEICTSCTIPNYFNWWDLNKKMFWKIINDNNVVNLKLQMLIVSGHDLKITCALFIWLFFHMLATCLNATHSTFSVRDEQKSALRKIISQSDNSNSDGERKNLDWRAIDPI